MKSLKSRLAVLFLSTICLLSAASGQFTPSQDASTFNHHGGQNYGTAQTIVVESIGPPPAIATSYIQFDLSSIPSSYTGANVTKASLKLFVQSMVSPGSFNVDLVNGSWTEFKIAYNNAPALGTTVASNIPLTTANINDYVIVDVTSAVQDWLDGSQANDGIALVANSGLDVSFDSKENTTTSHPAELDIVFAGAITSVNTPNGSGLMGGGTGNVSLSLTNACSINQVLSYNGNEWQCSNISGTGGGTVTSVGSGNGLTGGPITTNGTLVIDPNVVPQLGAASNNFTGNLSASSLNAANGFNLGGMIFDSGSPTSNNAFLGFAGNGTNPGTGNTASGWQALAADTTGGSNVASGYLSLNSNTSGSFNTALGVFAGQTGDGSPMTTSNNTFLGAGAEAANGGINNATAIGSNSVVGANNALVLGSIAGLNNATFSTNVGIGTTTPGATLDVEAPNGNLPPTVNFGSQSNPATFSVYGNTTIAGSGNALFFPDGSKQTTAYTGGGGGITSVTGTNGVNAATSGGAVTLSANEGVVAFQTDLTNGLANNLNAAESFATTAAGTAQANAESYANSTFIPLAAPGDLKQTVGGNLTEISASDMSLQSNGNMSVKSSVNMSLQSDSNMSLQSAGGMLLSSANVTLSTPVLLINGQTIFPSIATATASQGYDSGALSWIASSYNSSSGQPVNSQFLWQAEPIFNGTANASGTLNLLFGTATTSPAETGLSIASNGIITFANGQTFGGGGGGTVTSVGSGPGLTGGPITSSGSLSIAPGGVTNAMLANPSVTVSPGTDLTGGGTVPLGGTITLNVNTASLPELTGGNSFTGNQSVNGNIAATNIAASGSVSGSTVTGSTVSATSSYLLNNGTTTATVLASNTVAGTTNDVFLGYSAGTFTGGAFGPNNIGLGNDTLNALAGGSDNTATGYGALHGTSSGGSNTGSGDDALYQNTTGSNNTAVGTMSAYYNTTGSNNSALGYKAGPDTTTPSLNNATAIGAFADVQLPNSLVLGSIANLNGCSPSATPACQSANVGIGTPSPAATLDVEAPTGTTPSVNFFGTSPNPGNFTVTGNTTLTGNLTVNGTCNGCGGGGGGVTSVTGTVPMVVAPNQGAVVVSLSPISDASVAATANINPAKIAGTAATLGINTFSGPQTVNGNLSATGVVTGTSFQIGSNLFGYGSYANKNAFLGFAGGTALTTGNIDTAVGYYALFSNTTGYGNTASGSIALDSNTTGYFNTATGAGALSANIAGYGNTASGGNALVSNSTGNYNTAVGYLGGQTLDNSAITTNNNTVVGAGAALSTGTLQNATAIGSNALVGESNALVLGAVTGFNGGTSVKVGIGTATPSSALEVDANVPSGLGPTVTLTNNGGGGRVSLDVNTYPPSTSGTYNPAARILFADAGNYTDTIVFQSNKPGQANNTLQNTMSIDSSGNVEVSGNLTVAGQVACGGSGPSCTPTNLENLSGQLSTNGGVSYTGNETYTYAGTCMIGDTILSINGYGAGALPADGRLLQISQYAATFSLMGTNFGGDGQTTFGLPDLRAFAPQGLQYSICVYGIFPQRVDGQVMHAGKPGPPGSRPETHSPVAPLPPGAHSTPVALNLNLRAPQQAQPPRMTPSKKPLVPPQ
jgi:hypothetical protein